MLARARDCASSAVCLAVRHGGQVWPQNLHYTPGYTDALQDMGVEVAYGGDADSFRQWFSDNGDDLDYVLLCRPHVAAAVLPELRRRIGIGLLYYGVDQHFSRMRQEAKQLDDHCIARQAADMEMLERSIWRDVDVVLYPSDEECAIVAAAEPGVAVRTLLPYSFADFASPRPPAAEPVILFVGGFAHLPNRHGVFWFIDRVLPLIRARVTAAHFVIAGSNPPPDVLALAGDAITVRANVSDAELRELYRTVRVAVVPLRYGAGVKLKVVEALREGLPLVTTWIGAQGMPGLESVAAIHDEPQPFADAVCRLLTDGIAWVEQSTAQVEDTLQHAIPRRRFATASFPPWLSPPVAVRRGWSRRLRAPRSPPRVDTSGTPTSHQCPPAAVVMRGSVR